MASKHYLELLDHMRELHISKNHDYALSDNPFSNFEQAADYAGIPVTDVFHVMQGIKVARLNALKAEGKTPNNESILDTRLDKIAYELLELAYEGYRLSAAVGGETTSPEVFSRTEGPANQDDRQQTGGNPAITTEDIRLAFAITRAITGSYITDREEVKSGVVLNIINTITEMRKRNA